MKSFIMVKSGNILKKLVIIVLPLLVVFLFIVNDKKQGKGHQVSKIEQNDLPLIPVIDDFTEFDTPVQKQFKDRFEYLELFNKQNHDSKKQAWAIGQLCKLFHAYSLRDKAKDCYLNAVAQDENELEWRYLLAHINKSNGFYEEAISNFSDIIDRENYAPAKVWLAELYYENGEKKLSAGFYEDILQEFPNHSMALYGLALIKKDEKLYNEAIELLKQVEKIQPHAYQAHYQLGQIYARLQQSDKAKKHLAQVPEDEMLRRSITFIDPYMQEVSDLRRSAQSEVRRGRKAIAQNNYPLAVKYFEKSVEANLQRIDTRYNLALTLFRMGKLKKAENVLNELFLLDDKHKFSYLLMAKIHKKNNRDDLMQQYVNKANELD